MYEFVKNHPEEITSFCVIPSGEEIFATGAAVNKMVVENFFSLLKDDINNFIKENAYLMDENVTVSFGCKIFLRSKIDITMSHFVELVKEENIREASLMYLKLMYIMRYELAYELDKSKFSSLNASDLNLVIFFRNVVYNELQKYKSETREILINLTERLNNDTKFRERLESLSLNLKYGVKARNSQFISKIISGNKKAE
jgi:hypothetical protein